VRLDQLVASLLSVSVLEVIMVLIIILEIS
jgi:hypothetical protein